MVTHGIGFLPQCDAIIVMSGGVISEMGTYTELINSSGSFAQFLHTYQSMHESELEKDKGNENLQKCFES